MEKGQRNHLEAFSLKPAETAQLKGGKRDGKLYGSIKKAEKAMAKLAKKGISNMSISIHDGKYCIDW